MLLHSSIISNINTEESTDEKCFHVSKSLNNKNHISFYNLGREKVGTGLFMQCICLLNKVYILNHKSLFLTNAVLSRVVSPE